MCGINFSRLSDAAKEMVELEPEPKQFELSKCPAHLHSSAGIPERRGGPAVWCGVLALREYKSALQPICKECPPGKQLGKRGKSNTENPKRYQVTARNKSSFALNIVFADLALPWPPQNNTESH